MRGKARLHVFIHSFSPSAGRRSEQLRPCSEGAGCRGPWPPGWEAPPVPERGLGTPGWLPTRWLRPRTGPCKEGSAPKGAGGPGAGSPVRTEAQVPCGDRGSARGQGRRGRRARGLPCADRETSEPQLQEVCRARADAGCRARGQRQVGERGEPQTGGRKAAACCRAGPGLASGRRFPGPRPRTGRATGGGARVSASVGSTGRVSTVKSKPRGARGLRTHLRPVSSHTLVRTLSRP